MKDIADILGVTFPDNCVATPLKVRIKNIADILGVNFQNNSSVAKPLKVRNKTLLIF
jgi:hypothetical protein